MNKKSKSNVSGIKPEVVENHIGVYKYTNDDWSTIAFTIPRDQIGTKFNNKELQYNCIYFLFGFENNIHEKVYVGQAAIRLDRTSVLTRLREHDKSKTESYRDIWKWAVVVTNKENKWSTANLDALEHILCNMIPEHMNLKNPSHGGENLEDYDEKIKHIVSYVNTLNFKVFKDLDAEDTPQILDEINDKTEKVEDLQKGMSKIPEIVTPLRVVKAMIDMLPKEVWNDKTVFLDPACKGGEYLREIYDKLMDCDCLRAKYPDEFERHMHIVSKQLYGIALSQVSFERTTKNLRGYSHNIRIIPNYIHKLRGKLLGSNKTLKDVINEEFGKEMKIDVVIGNPPYNDNNPKVAKALYSDFMLEFIKITERMCCFITPARWYSSGRGLDVLRDTLLNSNHTKQIVDFKDSRDVFGQGVLIGGGVSYLLYDKQYNGKCLVYNTENGNITNKAERELSKFEIFVRDNRSISIIEKSESSYSISEYVKSVDYFGVKDNMAVRGYKAKEDDIHIVDSSGTLYCEEQYLSDSDNILDKYKVIVTHAVGGKGYVIPNTAQVLDPNVACSVTYICVGFFNKSESAQNMLKYIKTRFARFLLDKALSGINISKKSFMFVPMQDFTFNSDIDWSKSISDIDRQLYKKYNLIQDEIDYIESTIKPMD